jgi:hypothetical protein
MRLAADHGFIFRPPEASSGTVTSTCATKLTELQLSALRPALCDDQRDLQIYDGTLAMMQR